MHQIEFILLCLLIGVLLRLSGRLPETAPKTLAGWVINVALPAAALKSVHEVTLEPTWWLAAASVWIGVALAVIVLVPLSRAFGWSRQRLGALLLVCGWGNTSFVGLPMIAALAGPQWLGLGIFIDLFGSYLALSLLGIPIAALCADRRPSLKAIAVRIATFPPFLALLLAFATNHLERPAWIDEALAALAGTLTPLALAAVGYAIRLDRFAGRLAALGVGLVFRLVLAPLAILLLFVALGELQHPTARVAILEMAMPPMLGASIIALEHELEPDLVALLIGIGIPLSLLTTELWWALL